MSKKTGFPFSNVLQSTKHWLWDETSEILRRRLCFNAHIRTWVHSRITDGLNAKLCYGKQPKRWKQVDCQQTAFKVQAKLQVLHIWQALSLKRR